MLIKLPKLHYTIYKMTIEYTMLCYHREDRAMPL